MVNTADRIAPGEALARREFVATPELNHLYAVAAGDEHPRYRSEPHNAEALVHPSLLLHQSNFTRLPAFCLPQGMACVQTEETVEFLHPASVGRRYTVSWKVTALFERRGRPYQVKEALITDETGLPILRRLVTDTYLRRQ